MKNQHLNDLLALIAGILLTLAFAPISIKLLAIIAPAILLTTWLNCSAKRALWRGWLFGLGHFGSGVYWVYISIHSFGGVPLALAYLLTFGFVAILAIFPALAGGWLNSLFKKNNAAKLVFAFPVYWVILEWLRGWIFTGFPWLTLGDSQVGIPLSGFATVFSSYGVSLFALITSGLLVYLFYCDKKYRFAAIISIVLLWGAGFVLNHMEWTTPDRVQSVTLVQGNIEQSIKWSEDQVQPTIDTYTTLSKNYWIDNNIVIWPEAAVPLSTPAADSLLKPIADNSKAHNSTLITGIPVEDFSNDAIYNGIIVLGQGSGQYLKRHLVPFGEYFPASNLMKPLMGILEIPMSNFDAGKNHQTNIEINHIQFASFICYEIAYSLEVRNNLQNANVLLVISDDAWFGKSSAQAQHEEIAQMRAIETGRYVLFTSNNGITTIINNRGVSEKSIPAFKANVLDGQFVSMTGNTPWLVIGPWGLIVLLGLVLIVGWMRRRY